MMLRRSVLALVASLPAAAFTGGCGETAAPAKKLRIQSPKPGQYATTLIEDVPHIRQKPDFCGEALVAAYLGKLGKRYDQDDVFALSGMDPARGMGATTRELKQALEAIGFDPGPVWHAVDAKRASACSTSSTRIC